MSEKKRASINRKKICENVDTTGRTITPDRDTCQTAKKRLAQRFVPLVDTCQPIVTESDDLSSRLLAFYGGGSVEKKSVNQQLVDALLLFGTPYRTRTGVSALRGPCPGPLDERGTKNTTRRTDGEYSLSGLDCQIWRDSVGHRNRAIMAEPLCKVEQMDGGMMELVLPSSHCPSTLA